MSQHLISDDSGELIIEQEVSSEAIYAKRYQHPERPGGESGITIGIGYDCGYSTSAQVRKDWGGRIPEAMVEVLATRCAGLKGAAAQARLAEVRPQIVVPWAAAISEFYDVEVPRWLAKCRAVLPNLDLLPPDCIGALVSLAYNRGPSFTIPASKDKTGRYVEMRAIRTHMAAKEFGKIPTEFRKMKRLWTTPSVRGLVTRREEEAKLFERGLAAMPAHFADVEQDAAQDQDDTDQISARMPASGDDRNATYPAPDDNQAPAAVPADPEAKGDPRLFSVQKRLKGRHYSPGILDGKWGGGTKGALGAFMLDRGMLDSTHEPASMEQFHDVYEEVNTDLMQAEADGWFRPVTADRAQADAKVVAEVAPEVVPAKRGFWATISMSITAFFGAIWDTVSGWISQAWDFFTDHKDDIPDTDSGIMHSVWGYIHAVPPAVWFLMAAVGLGLLAWNAHNSVKKITSAVQTGARQ